MGGDLGQGRQFQRQGRQGDQLQAAILEIALEQAASARADVVEQRFELAGAVIAVRFAGPRLADTLGAAFDHHPRSDRDAELTIANVHLSFARVNAAAQLRRLRSALPHHRPTVVTGDCNLWGPALAIGVGTRFRRTVRGRTWPAPRPHSQLDHLLVSPEIAVLEAEIGAPTGSDHLPIRARLRVSAA